MIPAARCAIFWLPTSQGGRTEPVGRHYWTTVVFEGHEDREHPFGQFSMCFDFHLAPEDMPVSVFTPEQLRTPGAHFSGGTMHYLVGVAPHEYMAVGARFSVYEGSKLVGQGIVTEDIP